MAVAAPHQLQYERRPLYLQRHIQLDPGLGGGGIEQRAQAMRMAGKDERKSMQLTQRNFVALAQRARACWGHEEYLLLAQRHGFDQRRGAGVVEYAQVQAPQ